MQNHLIQQLQIEVQAATQQAGLNQRQQVSEWIKSNAFQRALENCLDRLVAPDEHLQIDHLELSIDAPTETAFRTQFLQALSKKIEYLKAQQQVNRNYKTVSTSSTTESAKIKSKPQKTQDLLLYFLQYGSYPWNIELDSKKEVRQTLKYLVWSENKGLIRALLAKAKQYPIIWKRLYYSIGYQGIILILKQQIGLNATFIDWLKAYDQKHFGSTTDTSTSITSTTHTTSKESSFSNIFFEDRATFWQYILVQINEGVAPSALQQQIENSVPSNLKKDFRQPLLPGFQDTNNQEQKKQIKAGIFIQNAGLVLLWMPLSRLFKKLGWIADNQFKNATTQQQAILLLDYLCYGTREVWEDELVLPKLLCGWDKNEPINTQLLISVKALTLADNLLQQFIEQWMPNRQFSIDWLRQHFLQRSGKLLQRTDDNWQLHIEHKTEDVLLNKLPVGYGYSVVRMRWMKGMLFVEW